ncbi:ornithine cyclodeaminase family protein [Modestobacter sp. VKM Ac-2978]|uniref:ornithine cyclodeaminase family protein n=1 Tax=Modestobacter sp. VKM Ac-2978 TaxID=3004132 RepID=UPI0022A9FA19|nr:ornithine cyclodeaminase family protein [Modestobacter sp. VKM Ac-2978]MCZ2849877.1 ornithine cyclodeaminase family protein [Modestobacter sp. VKM Ac-2978]
MRAEAKSPTDLSARLYLNGTAVNALLDPQTAIDLMRQTLVDYALGKSEQLHRRELVPSSGGGALGMMPAYQAAQHEGQSGAYAAKVVCVVHQPGEGPSHHGLCLLFDGRTGDLIAMLDAGAVTAIRTAAVTAVATDALARPNASVLTVLGTGQQALPHIEAIGKVRTLTDVRVWGRTEAAAERVASAAQRLGFKARPMSDASEAVAASDVVVTLTPARSPILQHAWLSPGTHVNAVGASTSRGVELDPQIVSEAAVFVDDVEAAVADAGDLLFAAEHSTFELDAIQGTIGDVLLGRAVGRSDPTAVTVFKSVGLAVEDLAVARFLNGRAREAHQGIVVPA